MPAGRRARRSLGSSVVLSYISVRKACSGDFAHDLGSDHHVDHNPAGRGDRNRWRGTLGIAVYPVAHATSLSYSAHSSDSQTAIVQRIESTHRSGVTTAPSTGSPRVSLCPHRLAPKIPRRSAFPQLSARRWWRRSTADASPPTEAGCCSAGGSDNSVSPIRLRR